MTVCCVGFWLVPAPPKLYFLVNYFLYKVANIVDLDTTQLSSPSAAAVCGGHSNTIIYIC